MPIADFSSLTEQPGAACPRCRGHDLIDCETTTSIWRNERPYVIEGIPALRCSACSEILIRNDTAEKLRRIARALPDGGMTTHMIEVPVISFPASAV